VTDDEEFELRDHLATPEEIAEELRARGRYACPIPPTPEWGMSDHDDPQGYYQVRRRLRSRLRRTADRYGFKVTIETLPNEVIMRVVTPQEQ
jgi:hypothetical protein